MSTHDVSETLNHSRRPMPPAALWTVDGESMDDETLSGDLAGEFAAAPELSEWIRATFIGGEGYRKTALTNDDHVHLQSAVIACLWTDVEFKKRGRVTLGTAEMPQSRSDWAAQRGAWQLRKWFQGEPDYLLTFYAPICARMTDVQFCALVEHELYHCAQKLDQWGAPAFDQDGLPRFAIAGHDVEEFVGVVARYGVVSPDVFALVEAAKMEPEIGLADVAGCCGTCLRKVA